MRIGRLTSTGTIAVAVVLLALTGCGVASSSSGPTAATSPTTGGQAKAESTPSASTTPVTSSASACTLPLTHAVDDGFHIAVPSGWGLSTLGGEAIVAQTPSQTEAVLIYPALLTNGLTATSFFHTYLNRLDEENATAGTPVSIHSVTGSGGLPAIDFTQTVNGTTLQGHATVEVLPLAAPGASQEAAYISYWAPAGSYASARQQLAAIAACYGPEPATPFRIFQDSAFTYAIPSGWIVNDENSNGIDLHGPDASDVSYILEGPVEASEFDTPQTMVAWFLNGVGITGVTSLSSSASSPQQTSTGATAADLYETFDGQLGSTEVQGLIYSYTTAGGGVASGTIRMVVAPVDKWNSLNPSMLQIAGSIQHDFSQDLAQLQQVNQQWQDFSGQVADFDDTLNQQQLVEDPSTGAMYEAPYSAYEADGPNGPGYYLANGDELNPVSRS
jgi:hypothetical protein